VQASSMLGRASDDCAGSPGGQQLLIPRTPLLKPHDDGADGWELTRARQHVARTSSLARSTCPIKQQTCLRLRPCTACWPGEVRHPTAPVQFLHAAPGNIRACRFWEDPATMAAVSARRAQSGSDCHD
jgi:hypothetical protein